MDESIESDCDEEIARISSEATQNTPLRSGRLHGKHNDSNGETTEMDIGERDKCQESLGRQEIPRPMSWDGGLSDNEDIVSN